MGDGRARIFPVEAARAIGAGGHAVTATDAAVPVHHHDSVVSLPRGLSGADAHARRTGAVITHQRNLDAGIALFRIPVLNKGKDGLVGLSPDPLYLVLRIGNLGNIMCRIAGADAGIAALLLLTLAQIHDHPPAYGLSCLSARFEIAVYPFCGSIICQ